ncbi:carboxypeptidase regulatory-like domain-containing protein [Myxococcus sp. CA051A]|uniref:carboxypeptidase regulatory-like domain-containing protein n=1 Tax=unclassified Myxococcus TaxID=2648731 RepID=UPI00157BAF9C|nr:MULTISPECIES: carboxypeptidase regulatory-like domain-containing protein [unclassified Myxococcus]NTX10125.1 carboxypeptidase regulatory-like domain-containing protein [Myxococcus sp. CA056]NTX54991.1 carboxypeptidase regulatory-like domain-containing protein [Myxococcus sp. CA039A]NTX64589.1 carboxypeptidase regulatory-like domain-containing protein [Myxococcus sp. CA051A]
MKRPILLASCVLLGLVSSGCGSGGPAPDPGFQTDDAESVDLDNLRIRVSGQAQVLPEAARLLTSLGQPVPSLGGMPVAIEEPLRVAVNDLNATFGTGAIAEDGAFAVAEVPVREVHQGLAVGLNGPGFVRTVTVVYDSVFTGARPRTDVIEASAWALPEQFHDALCTAMGEPLLRGHTEDRARTLRDAGFALGRVVDENGQPRAGVRVVPDRSELTERIYYPTSDLNGVNQAGTSAEGLFLYVHTARDAETFRLGVEGEDTYVARNVAVAPGWGLVLTLYPGLHPPP